MQYENEQKKPLTAELCFGSEGYYRADVAVLRLFLALSTENPPYCDVTCQSNAERKQVLPEQRLLTAFPPGINELLHM